MLVALIVVSVALAIAVALLVFNRPQTGGQNVQAQLEAESKARSLAEGELEKRKRDLEEHRAQLSEVKDQLKQTKKKLFDQRESDKDGQDLVKARAEVERSASLQLEHVRAELSSTITELQRLRAERDQGGRPRREPRPAPVAAAPQPVAVPDAATPEATGPDAAAPAPVAARVVEVQKPQRVIRELSEADREKMTRLEHQSNKDRARAAELEREVKRLKGKADTSGRVYTVAKGELDLARDKFKALEKRLNRTLLERDLMQRAIKELEKKTGSVAGRTELTSDEVAASDRKVEEAATAEAEARAVAAAAASAAAAAKAAEAAAAEAAEAVPAQPAVDGALASSETAPSTESAPEQKV